jgi:hypothetical protein
MLSRQVSWLAGQCCCPAFPKPIVVSVTLLDSGSPLTVAGAAPALAFYGRTGFPLSFGPNEPEEPRQLQLRSTAIPVNTDPDGQLPINPGERRWASEAIQACGMPSGTMVLMMEASSAS